MLTMILVIPGDVASDVLVQASKSIQGVSPHNTENILFSVYTLPLLFIMWYLRWCSNNRSTIFLPVFPDDAVAQNVSGIGCKISFPRQAFNPSLKIGNFSHMKRRSSFIREVLILSQFSEWGLCRGFRHSEHTHTHTHTHMDAVWKLGHLFENSSLSW